MKLQRCFLYVSAMGLLMLVPACSQAEKAERKATMSEIVTSENGLRYQVLTQAQGEAAMPTKGKVVRVHYTGWLNDGSDGLGNKFDSSVDRGQPFEFPLGVGYVIQGWDLGVADMKVGEKRRIFIPSALGYGARGAGAVIPPHADLIFDVELLAA